MSETVDLGHGRVSRVGTTRVAVAHLSNPAVDRQPLAVDLVVAGGDGEREFTLRIGDRFPAGEQTWMVRSIDGVGGYDYVVRVERVDGPENTPATVASPERQEELRRKWDFSSEAWQQSRERVRQAEQERATELFGGREPFAIPDKETDA